MMKRTILHIATALMMLAIFTACETEDLQTTFGGENALSIKLLLNAQGDDITRAISRSEGNDAYGENTIATADVFFYTANGTLLYNVAKENVTLSAPDANGVVTATVPMPSDKNIDMKQAKTVYVMGNRQATDAQVDGAKDSEASLRALTFTTNLATDPTAETTFAMDGTGNISVTNNEISGHVELVRAAAKITLTVNLPSTLTTDEKTKTYAPQTNGITVTFNNGVKTFGVETDVFDVEKRPGTAGTADANKNTPVTFDPFYSYPTTWETGDDNEPYFTLHVPWGETNAEGKVTSYTTYHYRVPINKTHFEDDNKTLALNRNHWYQVSVNVGVLGTPEASDEVELTANYEVKPWGNLPIGADLLDFKYLVVDQEKVEIYNQNAASVAFASSHPVTLEIISIKKWDYSTEDGTELNYAPSSTATDKSVVDAEATPTNGSRKLLTICEVDAVTGENPNKGNIELKHDLINQDEDTNDDVDGNGNKFDDHDYVSYTIVVKVSNGFYEEEITFIQYPEVYVTAYPNSDYEGDTTGRNEEDYENDNNNYLGGLYINGKQYSDSNNSYYGNAYYLGAASNENPNMYVITTTALSDGSTFLIGDPRKTDYDLILDNGNNWSTTATAIYDGTNNRQLKYYYPTNNSSETENVIAPKFRIASSYGVAQGQSYDNMRRRCASYQEDGYPAGRWRMPTKAEMEYVVRLSAEGKIPKLFNDEKDNPIGDYWCAHGVAYPLSTGTVNLVADDGNAHSVRCVYDDWYWGSEPAVTSADRRPFTWGDQPR